MGGGGFEELGDYVVPEEAAAADYEDGGGDFGWGVRGSHGSMFLKSDWWCDNWRWGLEDEVVVQQVARWC